MKRRTKMSGNRAVAYKGPGVVEVIDIPTRSSS